MKLRAVLLGLSGFVLFHLAWQLATLGNDVTDLTGPMLSYRGLYEMARLGLLARNVIASVFRVACGFGLGVVVGVPLGMLAGWNRIARESMGPLFQALRFISPIAWMPVVTIMFGGVRWMEPSDVEAIALIFYCTFFPIWMATNVAVRSIELKYLRSAANFGVTGKDLFRRVILPAALPQILTGIRLAFGIAWVVIVAVEMLGVQQGLGYQVNDSRMSLRYDWIFATMVVIAVTGLALDSLIARVQAATLAKRGMARR